MYNNKKTNIKRDMTQQQSHNNTVSIVFFLVCSVAYLFLIYYDGNKDMERYFHNFDKSKYYMLIYIKTSMFFIIMYNVKNMIFNYINLKKN